VPLALVLRSRGVGVRGVECMVWGVKCGAVEVVSLTVAKWARVGCWRHCTRALRKPVRKR
jgi:hypothetical protein